MKLEQLQVVDASEQLMNRDDDCSNGHGLTGPLPSFQAHLSFAVLISVLIA